MAIYGGPDIITDGLILCLDAANPKSYPGSGTTWTDLSGNGNNGTLTNGPTYSSANGGSIVFDGSNDYVLLPTGIVSSLTSCTVSFWFKVDNNPNWYRIIDFGSSTTVNMFFTPKNSNTSTPRFAITTGGSGAEQRLTSPTSITTNQWYNFTVTMNGTVGYLYKNTVLDATNNSMTLTPSSLGNTTQNYLGKSQYSDPYLDGNIGITQIYNRALTSTEILQNYNTLKSRFI